MNSEKFAYESGDVIKKGNKKTVRKVQIKNGKGYKSVSKYIRGKHIGTSKKKIHDDHLPLIKGGSFISGFFDDCKCSSSTTTNTTNKKTKKNKKY
jgi:hypothetical protein